MNFLRLSEEVNMETNSFDFEEILQRVSFLPINSVFSFQFCKYHDKSTIKSNFEKVSSGGVLQEAESDQSEACIRLSHHIAELSEEHPHTHGQLQSCFRSSTVRLQPLIAQEGNIGVHSQSQVVQPQLRTVGLSVDHCAFGSQDIPSLPEKGGQDRMDQESHFHQRTVR